MKVIVAKSAGFCWGVKRAVEKARRLSRTAAPPIHCDGPLIHNEQMLAQLRSEGILDTEDAGALRAGTLLIRAHGIPPERRTQLKRLPVRVVDATCPDVARLQGLIKRHAARGYHVIIFGDPHHPEVVGLMGYAAERGHVVSRVEDVAALPLLTPVCLVAQSTQFPEEYRRIAAAVLDRFPQACVFDTICEATKSRQADLLALAAQVEAIVVVGGRHSANTLRLVQLAGTLKPTFHIETREELPLERLRRFSVVGLTAGASTPDFVIAPVIETLEAI